jgi:glycine dehydrogenase subunit 1
MNYVPITDHDREVMLEKIGVSSVQNLLTIPRDVPRARLQLPPPLSEPELLDLCRQISQNNRSIDPKKSFLGAGAYSHYAPSIVRYISSRGEFLTAYTPYQPEASQGTLQAMYEFQSLICELTGMDVANASLYDGATAVAEACLVALRETDRKKLILSSGVHPEYRETVRTYFQHSGIEVIEAPLQSGTTDLDFLKSAVDSEVAAVVLQVPNALGLLEPVDAVEKTVHAKGALFITSVNPISLGILKPPGEYGADIVVGEGQPLGIDAAYGGPYLGLFACKQTLVRKMPGRVVGMTRDAHGRPGFVLTLQTREQHIRRAKATSNICTNEAMMALAAAVYMASHGQRGFRDLAEQNLRKAHYACEQLSKIPGIKPVFEKPFFNEFALELPIDPETLNRRLEAKGFLGGFPLARWDAQWKRGWLVCVTEVQTKESIDAFVRAVAESCNER